MCKWFVKIVQLSLKEEKWMETRVFFFSHLHSDSSFPRLPKKLMRSLPVPSSSCPGTQSTRCLRSAIWSPSGADGEMRGGAASPGRCQGPSLFRWHDDPMWGLGHPRVQLHPQRCNLSVYPSHLSKFSSSSQPASWRGRGGIPDPTVRNTLQTDPDLGPSRPLIRVLNEWTCENSLRLPMSPNFRKYVPLTFGAMTQVGGSGSSAEHEVSVNLRSRNCLFPKGWGRGGQETRDGSVTWAHRPVPGKKGRGRGRKRAGTCEVSCGAAGCNYRALGNRRHGPALLRHPLMADWHWSFWTWNSSLTNTQECRPLWEALNPPLPAPIPPWPFLLTLPEEQYFSFLWQTISQRQGTGQTGHLPNST